MSERKYPCEFCDTEQEQVEKLVTLTMKRNGVWYIFENVPAKICPNCGHRYFDGPMLLKLEKMILDEADGLQPVQAWTYALPQEKA